jgi:hypothetical protein
MAMDWNREGDALDGEVVEMTSRSRMMKVLTVLIAAMLALVLAPQATLAKSAPPKYPTALTYVGYFRGDDAAQPSATHLLVFVRATGVNGSYSARATLTGLMTDGSISGVTTDTHAFASGAGMSNWSPAPFSWEIPDGTAVVSVSVDLLNKGGGVLEAGRGGSIDLAVAPVGVGGNLYIR